MAKGTEGRVAQVMGAVVDVAFPSGELPEIYHALEVPRDADNGADAGTLVLEVQQHLGDETIQTMVEEGDFAETILRTAEETQSDIIVIGSHSQKWLENIVMGSVTEKVMNHSPIPLFIVPTRKQN